MDPDDGILQVAPKDWGSSESSFAVGKDTQMAGMWIVALREMAYLRMCYRILNWQSAADALPNGRLLRWNEAFGMLPSQTISGDLIGPGVHSFHLGHTLPGGT